MKTKFFAILIALIVPMLASATTATDALAKARQKLVSAKSVTAKFTGTTSGTLTVSGSKFAMVTPVFGVWYNGTDMWSYSAQTRETNLTNPTAAELLESNPLEVIKSYSSSFTASKVSEAGGRITLKLIPKQKTNPVKSATLVLNTKTWLPASIDMTFTSGERLMLNITSITEGGTPASSTFTYPKATYPKVPIIDLR